MNPLEQRLEQFIEHAWKLKNSKEYDSWLRRVVIFLETAVSKDFTKPFNELGGNESYWDWESYRDGQASWLEGQLMKTEQLNFEQDQKIEQAISPNLHMKPNCNSVFLVHGHDVSAKETTARFLEKLGLEVIILHEQASEGRTIIEKFEAHAKVGFAVVLLTPDDIGASATSPNELSGRARQNVILELGYFTGKLGRRRVCGLFKPGVEVPSDMHGVLFLELDNQGGWKTKIAQELVTAEMKIDLQALLQG